MQEAKGTPEVPITERRRQTRNKIYCYLLQADAPKTKQEIGLALGISAPTVHQNVMELLSNDLLMYAGAQRSTGGRRAMGLTANAGARFAVGISVTEHYLRLMAVDLKLNHLAYKRTETIAISTVLKGGQLIAEELENFLDEQKLERSKLIGVGIAVPGVIDREHNEIVLSPTLQLRNQSLQSIQYGIPYPCYIENDGTCGGLSEWYQYPGLDSMAYLSLEDGVGGSILLKGQVYPGEHWRSAEFGHMCVQPGGRPCQCGKKGCLEAYCSAQRLTAELGISIDEFFAQLGQGNAEFQAIWDDYLNYLALAVNNIHMMMDCDVVVGGFVAQYLDAYLLELRRRVARLNPFEENGDYVHLCCHPRHAIVLGAAVHFIQQFVQQL